MKATIILIVLACIFAATLIHAAEPAFKNEILTMFTRGTVDWPSGKLTMNVFDVTFDPPGIKELLLNHTAQTISLAFPDYDPADSILVSPRYPYIKIKQMELDLVFKIYLAEPSLRDTLNAKLNSFQEVLFSENNGTIQYNETIPDDPYFGLQWGLNNTGQSGGTTDMDIDAPEAWDYETGLEVENMVIFDSGVLQSHEDLAGKVRGDGPDRDHGTHVAGIAAAWGGNHTGITGVDWHSHILSKSIHGADYPALYQIIYDVIWNEPQIKVMNNSWALVAGYNTLICKVFAMAYALGYGPVCARGNADYGEPGSDAEVYPACYGDWIISVGACDDDGNKSSYSHYGRAMDFLAPGGAGSGDPIHKIYSCLTSSNDSYGYKSGTSMAAPHVTGIISLIESITPINWDSGDYEQIIEKTCKPLLGGGYHPQTGWGLVNAGNAMAFLDKEFKYKNVGFTGTPQVTQIGQGLMTCYGWLGLPGDNVYYVIKKEVTAEVNYEADGLPDFSAVDVWGSPILTTGLLNENPNYYVPMCEVVTGSETTEGCILKTYIFDVWSANQQTFYGTFPPDNYGGEIILCYTVVGDLFPFPPEALSITESQDYHPVLHWQASQSEDVVGYKIYRMVHGIDDDFLNIATVSESTFEYKDMEYSTPHPGSIAYWWDYADYTVTAIDISGESDIPPFVTIEVIVPDRPEKPITKRNTMNSMLPQHFELLPAYPNPFNALTKIRYALPEDAFVTLEILNLSGQKVATLVAQFQQAGFKEVMWDASAFSSGIYFYRIKAGEFSDSKRVSLLK